MSGYEHIDQRVGVVDAVEVVQGGEAIHEVVRSCSKPERGLKRKHKMQDESENSNDQNCTQRKQLIRLYKMLG